MLQLSSFSYVLAVTGFYLQLYLHAFAARFGFVGVHSAGGGCCEGARASPCSPSLGDKLGSVAVKSSERLCFCSAVCFGTCWRVAGLFMGLSEHL